MTLSTGQLIANLQEIALADAGLVADWGGRRVYGASCFMGRLWSLIHGITSLMGIGKGAAVRLDEALRDTRESFDLHLGAAYSSREVFQNWIQAQAEQGAGAESREVVEVLAQWRHRFWPMLSGKQPVWTKRIRQLCFPLDEAWRGVQQKSRWINTSKALMELQDLLPCPIPYSILAKVAQGLAYDKQDPSWSQFVSSLREEATGVSVRKLHRALATFVLSLQSGGNLSRLERVMQDFGVPHFVRDDLKWSEGPVAEWTEGERIEWGPFEGVLEKAIPELESSAVFRAFAFSGRVAGEPGKGILVLGRNEAALALEYFSSHRDSFFLPQQAPWKEDPSGLWRFYNGVEPVVLDDQDDWSGKKVDHVAALCGRLLEMWHEDETPRDLNPECLVWDRQNEQIRALKVQNAGSGDFLAIRQFILEVVGRDLSRFKALMNELKAETHPVFQFFEQVIKEGVLGSAEDVKEQVKEIGRRFHIVEGDLLMAGIELHEEVQDILADVLDTLNQRYAIAQDLKEIDAKLRDLLWSRYQTESTGGILWEGIEWELLQDLVSSLDCPLNETTLKKLVEKLVSDYPDASVVELQKALPAFFEQEGITNQSQKAWFWEQIYTGRI